MNFPACGDTELQTCSFPQLTIVYAALKHCHSKRLICMTNHFQLNYITKQITHYHSSQVLDSFKIEPLRANSDHCAKTSVSFTRISFNFWLIFFCQFVYIYSEISERIKTEINVLRCLMFNINLNVLICWYPFCERTEGDRKSVQITNW